MIDPACSFCGKKQREVAKLLGKPDAMVCDECVQEFVEVMIRDPSRPSSLEWLARLKRRIARVELQPAA